MYDPVEGQSVGQKRKVKSVLGKLGKGYCLSVATEIEHEGLAAC